MKILGGILGAILAPTLLVALVVAVYPQSGAENFDPVTPVMTIMAAAAALVVGAIVGVFIASALQQGDRRYAGMLAVATLVLIALYPGWVAFILYGPRPVVKPTRASERDAWAAERINFFKRYGFSEQPGLSLAWQVRTCQLAGGCETIRWQHYGNGEDSVAQHTSAYRLGDDGWRWNTITGSPSRTIVFVDPRLKREGPVFEVRGHDILRRATRDAPAFSTDSSLAAMLAMPECLARLAKTARAAGTWDGRADSLPSVIASQSSPVDGCPRMGLYTPREFPRDPWIFEIRDGHAIHRRFELTPDASNADTPFRFSFRESGRGFFREAHGAWHVRDSGSPTTSDPPPPPCMFDLNVPCATPTADDDDD
ncbi:MAG TPA: hypothetical protein VJR92_09445 [Gemmatimonadaceae bacterium]|nr:hypothetical protein [Gemmatimonadaceae bacterium]